MQKTHRSVEERRRRVSCFPLTLFSRPSYDLTTRHRLRMLSQLKNKKNETLLTQNSCVKLAKTDVKPY